VELLAEGRRTGARLSREVLADGAAIRARATRNRLSTYAEEVQIMADQKWTDLLAEIEEKQGANYRISREVVGAEGIAMIEEFQQLYLELAVRESASELPEKEEISVTHFLIECRLRLLLATLSIFRGTLSDSAIHTRRAIEAAAFLVAMRKRPTLFQTWLTGTDDEAREREYRDAFSSGRVLSKKSEDPPHAPPPQTVRPGFAAFSLQPAVFHRPDPGERRRGRARSSVVPRLRCHERASDG
jgi:hypothetical protein